MGLSFGWINGDTTLFTYGTVAKDSTCGAGVSISGSCAGGSDYLSLNMNMGKHMMVWQVVSL